jgi:glycosyltransferase involved in cell wall biosynthesis
MRIAQIASLVESVPPQRYGGTERVISVLTEELVRRGHEVTLFATGDSKTTANLVASFPTSLRSSLPDDAELKMKLSRNHVALAYQHADQFDIIHDHTGHIGAPFAELCHKPVIMTMHGAFNEQSHSLFSQLRRPYLVTISHRQAEAAADLNHLGTVYNGLPLMDFPFSDSSDGYLLFVGRICPEKGVHHAITVAERLGMPLIIAAKLDQDRYGQYFEEEIKPRLNDKIMWIGEVNEATRNQLYAKAYCFLHPVTWPEPFGLTLIEAMACGCPVVALSQGSIPEVVSNHQSGYVVDTVEEMIKAVKDVVLIKRSECRHYAQTTFDQHRMVNGYETFYTMLLEQQAAAINLSSWSHSLGGNPRYAFF